MLSTTLFQRLQRIVSGINWMLLIGVLAILLLLPTAVANAGHCPPDDTSDCAAAAATAKNPLVPVGGGLLGLIAAQILGGSLSAAPSIGPLTLQQTVEQAEKERQTRCAEARARAGNYSTQVAEQKAWWAQRCASLNTTDDYRRDLASDIRADRHQIWQDKFTLYRILASMRFIAERGGHLVGSVADYIMVRFAHFHPTNPYTLAALLTFHVEVSHQVQHKVYDPRLKEINAEATTVAYRLRSTAIRVNLKLELYKTWGQYRDRVAQSLKDNLNQVNGKLQALFQQNYDDWQYLQHHCEPLGATGVPSPFAEGNPPTVELPDLTDPSPLALFELEPEKIDSPAVSTPGHH